MSKTIGEYKFNHICKYSECYKKGKERKDGSVNNDFNKINNKLDKKHQNVTKGLYAFVLKKEILYIGESHAKRLSDRIKQHFREKDTGGLAHLLKKKNAKGFKELMKSDVYYCDLSDKEKRDILFIECELLGQYKPRFNFYNEKKNDDILF